MDDKEFDFGLIDSFDRLSDGSAHTRATPEQIAQSWKDDFSDPSKHDPNNFTYLVHGLQDETSRLIQRLAILQHAKGGDPTQDIDLLQNPMRISDKKIVSCSVIDQEHRETFGAVGMRVRTPAENVLRVASQDVGSNFFDPDAELSKGKRNLCTVAELLRSTSSQIYNEALLKGKTEQGEVQVKGFFVKVFEDGEPENPQMAQTIRLLSMRHGLPLISIVKKTEKYADKPAEIADDYITREPVFMAIQRGGVEVLNFLY